MTGAFDTHSHIQDPQLLGDFERVVARAAAAGLEGIALCGYDAPSNALAMELSARSPLLFPTVGFHPHEADDVSESMLTELASLAALPEIIGIGEIGLDFYRNLSSEGNQRRLLDRQLELAVAVRKPVCVHSRAAEDAIADHLLPFASAVANTRPGSPGVMHCFGGTLEQARPYVEAGFLVSVACTITYPKNDEARRLVRELPLATLVIETDSPYLPPQTRRGQLNEPAHVVEAARAIAAIRGEAMERVLEATTANARRLFSIGVEAEVLTA